MNLPAVEGIVLAIKAAHKRSRLRFGRLAAAAFAALSCSFVGLAGTAVNALATSAHVTSVRITSVRITSVNCVPQARCSGNPHQVSTHGTLLIAGKGLLSGMTVAFPRAAGARIGHTSPGSHLRKTNAGLVLTVPSAAHSGHIMVLLSGARHSSSYGPISVYKHPLPPPPKPKPTPVPAAVGAVSGSPFDGQGMWIWYVSK